MSKPPIKHHNFLALDVGSKRIGVARASAEARLAEPLTTLFADGTEIPKIRELIVTEEVGTVIIGRPRGLSGQYTAQTLASEDFGKQLKQNGIKVVYIDEALTSRAAESFLKTKHRPGWQHEDVDNVAAMIILTDYLSQP